METKTFAELGLSPKVQAAIEAAGYTTPTPIQAAAIPIALTGRDVLGIAQTGTGKTAAFVLPMITRLETGRARARMPRSLILAPTRELAAQVAQSFEKYGVNHKLNLALLIGGVSMDDQVKKLDRGVDVLIATPGRLLDHFQRGRIMLMGVEILVIDEADRMLDMGFIPDIEKICKLLPPRRQTLFFSATMPPEITRLVEPVPAGSGAHRGGPARRPPPRRSRSASVYCPERRGLGQARDAARADPQIQDVRNAIIFCNRKVEVAILHQIAGQARLQRRRAARRHGPEEPHGDARQVPLGRADRCWRRATSPRAVSTSRTSATSSTSTCPGSRTTTCTASAAPAAPARKASRTSLVTPDDLKSLKDIEKMLGEPVEWIGEAPSEQDYAEAGKRKRRGGRGAAPRGRGPSAGRPQEKGRSRDARPGQRGRRSARRRGRRGRRAAQASVRRRRRAQNATSVRSVMSAQSVTSSPGMSRGTPSREPSSGRRDGQSKVESKLESSGASRGPSTGRARSRKSRPERRPDHRAEQPRGPVAGEARGAKPAGQPKPQQERGRERQPQGAQRQGFADNVPAFLRNPVKRPAKVAGE